MYCKLSFFLYTGELVIGCRCGGGGPDPFTSSDGVPLKGKDKALLFRSHVRIFVSFRLLVGIIFSLLYSFTLIKTSSVFPSSRRRAFKSIRSPAERKYILDLTFLRPAFPYAPDDGGQPFISILNISVQIKAYYFETLLWWRHKRCSASVV